MNPEIAAIVFSLGEFALVGWVVWVVARRLRERAELRAQLQLKLLERFGSAQELADFLNTDAGRRFLASFSGERPVAALRILRAVQVGIGLSMLGLGLGGAYWFVAPRELPLGVAGGVFLVLGLGFLLAAAASYRLSRKLGIPLTPSSEDART